MTEYQGRPICPCGRGHVAIHSWRVGQMVEWDYSHLCSRCEAVLCARHFIEANEAQETGTYSLRDVLG